MGDQLGRRDDACRARMRAACNLFAEGRGSRRAHRRTRTLNARPEPPPERLRSTFRVLILGGVQMFTHVIAFHCWFVVDVGVPGVGTGYLRWGGYQ